MMQKYFRVFFEFDRQKVNEIIQQTVENNISGYVCVIDGNSLISANKDDAHLEALNNATVNLCDSVWTPVLINCIYGTKYKNYTGTDLFIEHIKLKKYRHFFLGSTSEILNGLKNEISKIDFSINNMRFETLPFRKVDEFDYLQIAEMINSDSPDIIWLSLGAPKQEQFMYKLKPFLNKGIMLGVGAVFNFNSGIPNQKRAPEWLIKFYMEWLFRTFQNPTRMLKRYWNVFISYPNLIKEEMRRKKWSDSHANFTDRSFFP